MISDMYVNDCTKIIRLEGTISEIGPKLALYPNDILWLDASDSVKIVAILKIQLGQEKD